MALFYLVILVTLVVIYRRRGALRLTGRGFAALCFDALACAPFAINLVRKLALRRSLAGNPIAFATEAFEPPALASLIDVVTARVKEDQLREDSHSPRWEVLEAYQQKLNALRAGPILMSRRGCFQLQYAGGYDEHPMTPSRASACCSSC